MPLSSAPNASLPSGDRRRVLLIGNNITSMLRFRGPLVRHMVELGHETHVLVPKAESGLYDSYDAELEGLRALGANVHEYSLQRSAMSVTADLAAARGIWRVLRQVRPDVVVSYMMKPVIYGSLLAAVAGVRRRYAILDGLGFAFGNPSGKAALGAAMARFLLKHALRRVQKLILLNRDDPRTLIDAGVMRPDMPFAIVAGTGLDLDHFAASPAPPGGRTFLMVSRLIAQKGVREFAAAAELVRATRPEARFVLVGDLDPAPGGIALDEVRGWSAIDYRGTMKDVRPAFAECLAFVLPSYYREGRPRTIMEAMAMGRASIIADNVGSRECIVDGETGLVVPARDVTALAAAMNRYLDRPEEAAAHGRTARQVAEATYAERIVTTDTLTQLGLIANRAPADAAA